MLMPRLPPEDASTDKLNENLLFLHLCEKYKWSFQITSKIIRHEDNAIACECSAWPSALFYLLDMLNVFQHDPENKLCTFDFSVFMNETNAPTK